MNHNLNPADMTRAAIVLLLRLKTCILTYWFWHQKKIDILASMQPTKVKNKCNRDILYCMWEDMRPKK
jgi:hypothetical protein